MTSDNSYTKTLTIAATPEQDRQPRAVLAIPAAQVVDRRPLPYRPGTSRLSEPV